MSKIWRSKLPTPKANSDCFGAVYSKKDDLSWQTAHVNQFGGQLDKLKQEENQQKPSGGELHDNVTYVKPHLSGRRKCNFHIWDQSSGKKPTVWRDALKIHIYK